MPHYLNILSWSGLGQCGGIKAIKLYGQVASVSALTQSAMGNGTQLQGPGIWAPTPTSSLHSPCPQGNKAAASALYQQGVGLVSSESPWQPRSSRWRCCCLATIPKLGLLKLPQVQSTSPLLTLVTICINHTSFPAFTLISNSSAKGQISLFFFF